MFRHFLSIWLIVCTLGYSSAWAFDVHSEETVQQEVMSTDIEQIADSDNEPACDHCCHAAAHMMGLWSTPSLNILSGSNINNWSYLYSYLSLQIKPLKGPPIS